MATRWAVAQWVAARYAVLDGVRAVAVGGSLAVDASDESSDVDLYLFTTQPVAFGERAAVAAGDPDAEIDNRWFGTEDAWIDRDTGLAVDVSFFPVAWIESELDRVLVQHQARVGYSTAFWATIRTLRITADESGWLFALQQRALQPYPEELRRAVIDFNLPLLRDARSAFTHQLEKAVCRGDLISVNHRSAAFLASYFDVLFALNRLPHPGEKRQLVFALENCGLIPAEMHDQIEGLLRSAAHASDEVLRWADALSDGLERLVQANS